MAFQVLVHEFEVQQNDLIVSADIVAENSPFAQLNLVPIMATKQIFQPGETGKIYFGQFQVDNVLEFTSVQYQTLFVGSTDIAAMKAILGNTGLICTKVNDVGVDTIFSDVPEFVSEDAFIYLSGKPINGADLMEIWFGEFISINWKY